MKLILPGQHCWRPGEDSDLLALKYRHSAWDSEELNAGLDYPLNFVKTLVTDNNLADGTGKPCAGHDRQNGSDSRFSTVELFSPRLNIGADPPIGSKS